MLSTLIFVFKILLTVFLAILALAVLMLLLVLCVPIRYRIYGSYQGELEAGVKITWFFHLLSVPVTYDKTLKASVKVLGFPILKVGGEKDREDGLWDEKTEEQQETEGENQRDTWAEGEGRSGGFTEAANGNWSDGFTEAEGDDQSGGSEVEDGRSQEEISGKNAGKSSAEIEGASGAREHNRFREKRKKRGRGRTFSLENLWESIKRRIRALCKKAEEIKELYERVCDFVRDEANQKSFRKVLRIIKHVLPKKISGNITFGFRDPAMTGKVLALLGFACIWYGDTMEVTPVFEEEMIEGTLRVKGRIFPGALLFWGLTILMNKNIRRLILKRGRKKDGGREDGRK